MKSNGDIVSVHGFKSSYLIKLWAGNYPVSDSSSLSDEADSVGSIAELVITA